LLLGGNGSLARTITQRFSAKGITVHSVIRDPKQASHLKALGASPIVQSVEDSSVSDFVKLIKNVKPDVVIWSAGAGGGSASAARLKRVDTDGHIKVMDAVAQAAEEAGTTRRYITISSLEVRDEVNKPVPDWYDEDDRVYSKWAWPIFRPYFQARLASDKDLVEKNGQRRLEYTIVRPGWMSLQPGTGRIGAGKCNITGQVSRDDVTSVLEVCMESSRTIGLAFDVASGNVPISEAVNKAEDSFKGYH
ncbi:NAD-dependent epimerase/dehydratase, partial [Periconia macrospinosa]